ncbi:MAG: site-2 protease family protein [Leptospirales bacterium]|nr:site-2 protease family protein [Leptospirales bacterium]
MLAFILGGALMLGVCIFLHELGHYLFGRLVGVHAEVFSIGYGRGIWKRKIGETTWQITAIPLGGYVLFKGADYAERHREIPGGFYSVGPLKRMIPVLGGPIFNLVLGALVLLALHLSSGPLAPRIAFDPSVRDRAPAFAAGLRDGDLVAAINGQAVASWTDLVNAVALSGGAALEFDVLRDGQSQRFTVHPLTGPGGISEIGVRMPGDMRISVDFPFREVWNYRLRSALSIVFDPPQIPPTLAALPYLRDGDVILSANGVEVHNVTELQQALALRHGQEALLILERESLPWLAPWFTEREEVRMPSSAEFIVRLREVVDLKYNQPVADRDLYSRLPEYEQGIAGLQIDGRQAQSFPNIARMFPESRAARIDLDGRGYSAIVRVEPVGALGFIMSPQIRGDYLPAHASAAAAAAAAAEDLWKQIAVYPAFFQKVFSGRVSFIENTGGPVKIFMLAGVIVRSEYQTYFTFFAFISIALFVMNMMPFPMVDGGHLVMFAYEAISGRMPSIKVLDAYYRFGLIVLLGFGAWVMYRDLLWSLGL